MGKKKKGFNWEARKSADVEIDDNKTKKIQLEIQHRADNYDSCNILALPSEKRKTKKKEKQVQVTRLLSKKRRKLLEKVVERKEKKLRRATLLEELAKVQAPQEELKQYISLTTLQTKGLKRHFRDEKFGVKSIIERPDVEKEQSDDGEVSINAIKGAKRKRMSLINQGKVEKSTSDDPNCVGLHSSSDDDSEESSEDECSNSDGKETEMGTARGDAITDSKEIAKKDISICKENPSSKPKDIVETKVETIPSRSAKKSTGVAVRKEDFIPAVNVPINRTAEIQEARLKLPILAEEQLIVETINENPFVIVTGETGSGKTTQVPQFLYEAGYAKSKMIGITEPRRVAAMAMSKRVAEEMNLTTKEVSYLIRFEGNVTPDTKIKFMTDGVLLKEIQNDFMLSSYSVIILDEAHERSVYTDILIGLLSRIVPLRHKKKDPLKLIVMSASLRVEDFVENTRLFKVKPPVFNVEARQFPVTIHFNRKTPEDYLTEALKKVIKIHTQLPEGGILVFLTGQQEVDSVVRKLQKMFPYVKKKWQSNANNRGNARSKRIEESYDSEDEFDRMTSRMSRHNKKRENVPLPQINLDDYPTVFTDDTHEDLVIEDEGSLDDDEDQDDLLLLTSNISNKQPLWVLPLYSKLSGNKQARVFEPPPEDCRLCIVSTNVAETSLTIPNVKYVVDCGRSKIRMYDKLTGVSTYKICYASKAAASQRAGRSGRTQPGHCYRLYSSAVFNDQFEQFSEPEIRRKPVDDLMLQMKVMNIDKVVNFPFPTAPDIIQLKSAEQRLCVLGALEQPSIAKQDSYTSKVTPLGKSIAAFPVGPRYGKMLALSHQHNLLKYTVCMVAALSVQEVLIEPSGADGKSKSKWQQMRRFWAGAGNSLLLGDPMVLIRAVGAAEYSGSKDKLAEFCEEHGLRLKAITEIRKLRQQLTNEILLNIPSIDLSVDPNMQPPSELDAKLLRQIVLAGMGDQVARKVSLDEIKKDEDKAKWKHAYKTAEMEDPVFMYSSSVLKKTSPEWVVYQEIFETTKLYMRGVTAIEPEWLPKFVPSLCHMNEPLEDPSPRYHSETGKVLCHMSGTFGRSAWELPIMELEYPQNVQGVRWFARFLLEGEICPVLKQFVPHLLSSPATVVKSWAKLLPRTEILTNALLSNGVMSKDKLDGIWNSDKTYLLSAYKQWLPESAHHKVSAIWPPL